MKNNLQKLLLGLFIFGCIQSSYSQTEWYTEDFETVSEITTIDDKAIKVVNSAYSIWYDGGSKAYQKDSEYMTGSSSYVVAAPEGDSLEATLALRADKPYYGSIYTEMLDLSNHNQFLIDINYLFVNKNRDKLDDFFLGGYGSYADIYVQVSNDGGETFKIVHIIDAVADHCIVGNKTLIQVERDLCVGSCNIFGEIPGLGGGLDYICATACNNTYDIDDVGGKNWGSVTVDLSDYMSNMTIIRLKSGFAVEDFVTQGFLDDVALRCDGCQIGTAGEETQPKFSQETIVPESDPETSGRTLYESQNFDSESDDWGIWEDGGRSAYSSEFLAASGRGICLRSFYSGKSNGLDPDTGEDLGFQKPSYSAIVTENLDFTAVQDLEMSFSFVSYQMSLYDPSDEELEDAGNANLFDEDTVSILGYVPGVDYIEISLSTNSGFTYVPVKTITYGTDFINKVRYDFNINIPGDITSAGALTTTTKIKIQCFSDTDDQQFYIDDLSLYTIGSNSSPEGTAISLDWEDYDQTTLSANSDVSTYDLINGTLIKSEYFDDASFEGNNPETDSDDVLEKPGIYGAVEHPDCDHPEFGEHITQEYDDDLEKTVFAFNIHLNEDTDRCRTDGLYDDRQRLEIKAYSESEDHLKAVEGETHFYAWKMKLPEGFEGSDKFTHLHQLKPKGGDNEGMPTITLTANGSSIDLDTYKETEPASLKIRYSPTYESQVTVASAPLSEMNGKWVQILEKVTYGVENEGRYELLIYDPSVGMDSPILEFESFSFDTWKGGDFVRAKWGIYRSILQPDKIKDEIIGYSDFVMLEVSDYNDGLYGDIKDFGDYISTLETSTPNIDASDAPIGSTIALRKSGGDELWVTAEKYADDNQLIARGASILDWEKFLVEEHPNGGIGLKALSTEKYVQVQGSDQYAPIRAAGEAMSTLEQFEWTSMSDTEVALQSVYTGKWIQANWDTDYSVLYPIGEAASGWETFFYEIVDTDLKAASNAQAETTLLVHPNPASNDLYINGVAAESLIKVIDLQGRTVLEIENNTGQDNITIDISSLPTGIYTLHSQFKKGIFIKK